MKKTMMFAVILMPLVILGMLFLGGTIVYQSTYLYVEYIEFVDDEIVLDKPTDANVSEMLQVNVYPKLANNKDVVFRSANEAIAVVDSEGKVTSRDMGTTYIYAESKENSTKIAACKVTVTSDRVHRVWVDNPVKTMYVGDPTISLNPQFVPIEAKNAQFEYTSSDPSVLSVTEGGTVEAKGFGKATITITVANDDTVRYSFEVNVKVRVQDLTIDSAESSPLESGLTEFTFPEISFTPAQANEKIIYTSSDPEIATVGEDGKITFLQAGIVTISAQAEGFDKIISRQYTSTFRYIERVAFDSQNGVFDYEDYSTGDLPINWSFSPADADKNNVSLSSSDERVIKIVDGKIKAVGGGTASITITAKTGQDQVTTAEYFVTINRKVTKVEFRQDNILYTGQKAVDLAVTYAPSDATEQINYQVSESNIATFADGVLTFTEQAVANKYAKVRLTAGADSGVSDSITVIYIDSSVERVKFDTATQLDYTLPLTSQPIRSFALVSVDVSDIDFEIVSGGGGCLSLNGGIVTLREKGEATLAIKTNGATTADKNLVISVQKLVERIDNVEISAIMDGTQKQAFGINDTIYSACDEFGFSYTLWPANTTLTTASLSLVGKNDSAVAKVENGKVKFTRAGKVTVKLSANNATQTVQIESTCGHPDASTAVVDRLEMNKGDSLDLWEKITVSPVNASTSHITFASAGDAISLADNGTITALHGGEATISVSIETATEILSRQITVSVLETATKIVVAGAQYIYTNENTVNLADKFTVLPATANKGNTFNLSIEPTSVATISSANVLQFNQSGRAVVTATLANNEVAKIAVVYTGDSIVVEGNAFQVLAGTTIMIKPDNTVLSDASYDTVFTSNIGVEVTNGVFLTVSGDASVQFGETIYNINCVERITAISLTPKTNTQVDVVSEGEYVTGLSDVDLASSVSGVDSQYLTTSFATSGTATVSPDGKLRFTKTEKVTVTFEARYKDDIIGADDVCESASIVVESTFGNITSVVSQVTGRQEFTFNNSDPTQNKINIANYISVYPTQLTASAEQLEITATNTSVAKVNGLEVTFDKGGESSINISVGNTRSVGTNVTIDFLVKRSATSISLNGKTLSAGDSITVSKSTVMIVPKAEPSDANVDNTITWDVVGEYATIATKTENSIIFKEANQSIDLRFTMGSQSIAVHLQTSTITYNIDINDGTFVVPVGEPFTFVDGGSDISSTDYTVEFTGLNKLSTTADIFQITESALGTATVTYNDATRNVNVIVTTNLQSISGVKINDTRADSIAVAVDAVENTTSLVTASKSVKIDYTIPSGYDQLGNPIAYTVSTASDCASVDGDSITFTKAGVANITISIEYVDAYSAIHTVKYSFSIESTFGCVTDFDISKTNYAFVLDTMSESDKVIDLASILTRKAPLYGQVDAPVTSLTGDSIASVSGCVVTINTFGTCVANVLWGTKPATVEFKIDKYIDEIAFVDNGETVRQIVTKASTYQINHRVSVKDSVLAPTLTGVRYSATGACTVSESGLVTFTQPSTRCEITVSAKDGSAKATLIITRVSDEVTIISPSNSNVVIEAGKKYIFDCRDSDTSNAPSGEGLTVDEQGVFTVPNGTTGEISINNSKVNMVVTEEVSAITFGKNAPSDGYVTALGSKTDGKEINITTLYAPAIYPATARPSEGEYVISYSVDKPDIAYIEGDNLVFNHAGTVTLTFSVGGVEATRTIQSTLGMILSVTISENAEAEIVRDYSVATYTLPAGYYTACPSDYYATSVTLSSSDTSVFTTENDTLHFVGGGNATLGLNYRSPDGEQVINKTVRVLHRAQNVDIIKDGRKTAYVVTNFAVNDKIPLQYECVPTADRVKLSQYSLAFESSNTSVATVDSTGVVTVVGNGETNITVKVINAFDSQIDASQVVKIVNDSNYNILSVPSSATGQDYVIDKKDSRQAIIYPMPNTAVDDFEFAVVDGNSVTVDESGKVSILSGGESTVRVLAGDWAQSFTIYVHKVANIALPTVLQNAVNNNSHVVTSMTDYPINATFGEADALERKTIEYSSSDTNIATVGLGGLITFTSSNVVKITVRIKYNGSTEASQAFNIRSTLGKVESFELNYSQNSVFVGGSIAFTVTNILPTDFVGGKLSATSSDETVLALSTNGYTVTATGKKAGFSDITVGFTGFSQKVSAIQVIQLTTGIEFTYRNKKVSTALNTSSNIVELTAIATPIDATDKGVTLSVESGPASITDGKIVFTEFGTAIIKAVASDYANSRTQTTIQITYRDITAFTLSPTNKDQTKVDEASGTVYVRQNWDKVEIDIDAVINDEPAGNLDSEILENFAVTEATNGATAELKSGRVVVTLRSYAEQPMFETTVTVKYKQNLTQTITIHRDGLKDVVFVDHNNVLEEETCGLQQIRVIGKKSYYGGVQNYYIMPITFTAGADKNDIMWEKSNEQVELELSLDNATGTGNVKLDFTKATTSSLDEVYADNFENGKFILTARDRFGNSLYQYTFHLVDAVNIWDQAGYLNAGDKIVLQKSLGHDDQAERIANGECSRLDAYADKNTIYGNGHLINYAYLNKTGTVSDWGYISVSLTNIINLEIQGTNPSDGRSSYHIQLANPKMIAYCNLHDMFRAVELGDGTKDNPNTINIKNTLFRTFAHSAINASNDGKRIINLENVIMFDVGYRAIECQSAKDRVNILGVFDVYNYQNSASLRDAVGEGIFVDHASSIIEAAEKAGMATTITYASGTTEVWVNVVILATKQTAISTTEVYYNGKEINDKAAKNEIAMGAVAKWLYGIKAWATTSDYGIKWSDEFYEDSTGTLQYKEKEMMKTICKLKRNYKPTESTSASQ